MNPGAFICRGPEFEIFHYTCVFHAMGINASTMVPYIWLEFLKLLFPCHFNAIGGGGHNFLCRALRHFDAYGLVRVLLKDPAPC